MYDLDPSEGVWNLSQQLLPADPASSQMFGDNIALDGDRMAIGARGDSSLFSSAGAVYIFEYDGAQWVETAKLFASDAKAFDIFGSPVALDGDRFVTGAQSADFNGSFDAGIAYVFDFDGTTWTETARISPPNVSRFPTSLDVEGDRFVAGNFGASVIGTVFVYDLIGSTWTQTQALEPADGESLDQFGISVEMDGDLLVSGSAQAFLGTGKVTAFQDLGAGYVDLAVFNPAGAQLGDQVGLSCSIDGNLVAAGSWFFDGNGLTDTGAVWTYSLDDSLCPILAPSQGLLSLSDGGTSLLSLDADSSLAAQRFVVAGSITGTDPGFPLGAFQVPLIIDSYFQQTLTLSASNPLGNSFGSLNSAGNATTSFTILPNADPTLVGLEVKHAAVIFSLSPLDVLEVSNAASITLMQ